MNVQEFCELVVTPLIRLKSAVVEAYIPWKLANATNQGCLHPLYPPATVHALVLRTGEGGDVYTPGTRELLPKQLLLICTYSHHLNHRTLNTS